MSFAFTELRTTRLERSHFSIPQKKTYFHFMFSLALSITPCEQQYSWSVYLNAPIFTTTQVLDTVSRDFLPHDVVRTPFAKLKPARGPAQSEGRRLEGFQESWSKLVYDGQELDPETSLQQAGIFSVRDGALVITVVTKQIAAEGEQRKPPIPISLFPARTIFYV